VRLRKLAALTDSSVELVSRAFVVIGAILVAIIALWTVTDVTLRWLRLGTISGTHEVVSAGMGAITFLFVPYVARMGRQVRSTIVVSRLPRGGRAIALRLGYAAAAAGYFLIGQSGWGPAFDALESGAAFGQGGYEVAEFPTRLTIVVGSLLAMVECLIVMIKGLPPEATPLEDTAEASNV
jgi:TRAP-type C4-dicarboxylate transport system permease small subunit